MLSREQPTPPFNSPYQHALKPTSLLHSPPTYPSPARSDTEPPRYTVDGLGLYNYTHPYPASGAGATSTLYTPPPQPTEAWHQYTASTSPLMSDAIVDPWASGAYDHPVSRSPLSWAGDHPSHRNSLSSTREVSIFSHDGSEHTFPQIKLEAGSPWASTDEESSSDTLRPPPSTVAPERLTTSGIFPYNNSYNSPQLPKFEPIQEGIHDNPEYGSMPYGDPSRSPHTMPYPNGITPRTRHRRTQPKDDGKKLSCQLCGKVFGRNYNLKQHKLTHDPNRVKAHACPHAGCDIKFVRKTDLDRHDKSVHRKSRRFRCIRCDARFPRRDTLRRHEEDGCSKRNQLSNPQFVMRYRDDSFPARL